MKDYKINFFEGSKSTNIRIILDLKYPSETIDQEGLVNIANDISKDPSILIWLKEQFCYNIKVEKLKKGKTMNDKTNDMDKPMEDKTVIDGSERVPGSDSTGEDIPEFLKREQENKKEPTEKELFGE